MSKKKSQFFMLDLIFSFIIIIVAVGIALYYTSNSIDRSELYDLNIDMMNQYTTTSINSLNNQEIRDLFLDNQITSVDNTIAQQVGVFVIDEEIETAKNITRIFASPYVRRDISVQVNMINSTDEIEMFYLQNTASFENSKTSYRSTREVIFLDRNEEVKTFTVEIKTWQ